MASLVALLALLLFPFLSTRFTWLVGQEYKWKGEWIGAYRLARPLRVLLIDDDPDSLVILESILVDQGIEYDVVNDSVEGVAAIGRGLYDLIILDHEMPKGNGPEVLLRAEEMLAYSSEYSHDLERKIPVVGFSGLGASEWNVPKMQHFQLMWTLSKGSPPSVLKEDLARVCESVRRETA